MVAVSFLVEYFKYTFHKLYPCTKYKFRGRCLHFVKNEPEMIKNKLINYRKNHIQTICKNFYNHI